MVPIMQSTEVKGPDGKMHLSQTYLSDYQSVGDMMMPMTNESKMDSSTIQKMTLSNMVLNPDIDESIFTMPTDTTGGDQ